MARKKEPVEGVYQREESGRWYARYWKDGKKVRKSFGHDRDAAIAYLEKARTLKRTGEGEVPTTAKRPVLTFAEMKAEATGVLFGDLCDGLLAHIRKNPTEYKDQRNPPQRIQRIKSAFGDRRAASIEPHEIAEWLDKELEGLAPATKNRYKAMLSAIFTFGVEGKHKLKANPARELKQRRVNNGVVRWLRPEEEKRLRAVLQKDVDACGPKNERLKKHMLHRIYELDVALGTGMRKGEQYSLVWPDVHFDIGELIARDTKNGTDRVVIMIDDVITSLKALKALNLTRKRRSKDRVNQSPADSVFSIGDNKKWWAEATRKAKINDFRWHDLRHTFCSRLAQKGYSTLVIKEAAGHKTLAMAGRYAHLDTTTMKNAMASLNHKA
jgi:integrase